MEVVRFMTPFLISIFKLYYMIGTGTSLILGYCICHKNLELKKKIIIVVFSFS